MRNLALIPKQQEFKCPTSLTHKIAFHPQTHFIPFQTYTQNERGKKSVPHHYFIKDTVAGWSGDPQSEEDEQQNKDDAKTDELWAILPIVELSSLVLGTNKHAEYM